MYNNSINLNSNSNSKLNKLNSSILIGYRFLQISFQKIHSQIIKIIKNTSSFFSSKFESQINLNSNSNNTTNISNIDTELANNYSYDNLDYYHKINKNDFNEYLPQYSNSNKKINEKKNNNGINLNTNPKEEWGWFVYFD